MKISIKPLEVHILKININKWLIFNGEGRGEGQFYSPLNSFISQKNFDHPVKTIHNPFKKVIFLILENFQ